jgi:hypothetical protein
MGDAGWAGQVADWFVQNANEPVYLLFEPGRDADLLPLFCEALALVPMRLRWEVTFATYSFTTQTLPCAWRGLAIGSLEAQKVLATRQEKVLRLHATALNEPRMSVLVAAARTGREPPRFDSDARGSSVSSSIEEEETPLDEYSSDEEMPERHTRVRPPELPQYSSAHTPDSVRSGDHSSRTEPPLSWPTNVKKRRPGPATVALPSVTAGIFVGLGLAWLYSELKESPATPRQAPLTVAESEARQTSSDWEKRLDEQQLKSLEQTKKLQDSNQELRARVTALRATNHELSNGYKNLKNEQKRHADLAAAKVTTGTVHPENAPREAKHGGQPAPSADVDRLNSKPLEVVKNYCNLPPETESELQPVPKFEFDEPRKYELNLIYPPLPLPEYQVSPSAKQVDRLDIAIQGVGMKPIPVAAFVRQHKGLIFRWQILDSLTDGQKLLIRRWLRDSVLSVQPEGNPQRRYIGLKRRSQKSDNLRVFQNRAPTQVPLTWSKEDQPLPGPETLLFVGSVKCQRVTDPDGLPLSFVKSPLQIGLDVSIIAEGEVRRLSVVSNSGTAQLLSCIVYSRIGNLAIEQLRYGQ